MTNTQVFLAVIAAMWGFAALVVAAWFVYCARRREFPEQQHEGATADRPPLPPEPQEAPVGRHHEDTVQIVPSDYHPHIGSRLIARETQTQPIDWRRVVEAREEGTADRG